MSKKFNIGAVCIVPEGGSIYDNLMGDPRVEALTALYKGEPLAPGLKAFVYGHGEVTRDDVNWDTSGIPKGV